MATAYQVAVRLGNIIDNWDGILADALENSRDLAVDLNRIQLGEGKRSDGKDITPPYKRITILHKEIKGQPKYVTLKDTGEFWSKFYLRISGTRWAIDSTDNKRNELVKKYTDNIFGLTSESKRTLWVEQMRDEVMRIIKGYLKQ